MLLRLILAVMIACLSFPAMATPACHVPETTVAEQHGHHAPAPASDREERAQPAHVCIGCIPPSSLDAGAIGDPLPPVALPTRALADDLAAGRAILPAVPPPRSFA